MSDLILVVGGTGDLGSRVVRLLVDQGRRVRCLLRPGSDDEPLRDLGVDVSRGDLTDATSLRTACRDVGTVVATATVMGRRLTGTRKQSVRQVDELGMG